MSDAKVFARPRKRGDDVDGDPNGELGEGREKAGCKGDRLGEEVLEGEFELIGTLKVLRFASAGLPSESEQEAMERSSSGISSGAGIGSPLAAATS